MVFLQYEWRDTYLHNKAHPLTKIAIVGSLFVLGSFYLDPLYTFFLLVAALLLARSAKMSFSWFTPLFIVAFFALIFWGLKNLTMIKGLYFHVIPPEVAETYIWKIFPPGTPIVGEMALTVGNSYLILQSVIKPFFLGSSMLLLIWTTPISELVDLVRRFLPPMVIFPIVIAFRFVPVFLRRITTIQHAQILRGWQPTNNPVKAARSYWAIFNPALVSLMELATGIMRTAKARAVGASTRVPGVLHPKPLSGTDKIIIASLVVIDVILLYLLFVYNMGTL